MECSNMQLSRLGGGHDSIVNLFDLSEWICIRTITACEYVLPLIMTRQTRYLNVPCAAMLSTLSASRTTASLSRSPTRAATSTS